MIQKIKGLNFLTPYLITLAAIAVALLIHRYFQSLVEGRVFLFLYPAVFLCGMLLGSGPGLFATFLAVIGAWYFYGPLSGNASMDAADIFSFFIFILAGVTFSFFSRRFFNIQAKERNASLQLLSAKEAAEAANLAKTQFLTNVSHEIRTPLGIIIGFADLAISSAESVETKQYLQKIKHHGQELNRLLGEVLDLAKVEANRFEIEEIPTDLVELVKDTLGFMDVRAHEKNLSLFFKPSSILPKTVVTDPTRLRQILINLVGNAIKFTDAGVITVRVRTVNELVPEEKFYLEFEVEDTGIGISQAYQKKLFQPFSQADSSLTRRHGGSGLGLMISRKLAQALGGDLKLVKSDEGLGSCFSFTISGGIFDGVFHALEPVRNDPLPAPKEEIMPSAAALAGKKILLVEDAVDNQILVTHYLNAAGGEVQIANNGEEAIPLAMSGRFDLVVMDLQMPVLDGYQATAQLRSRGFREPIVALTAHAIREEKKRALANGFDAYLTKPVNRSALIDTLATIDAK